MARGFSAGGTSKQATFSGSAQDAFSQALNAVNATNTSSRGQMTSQVTWQQPPSAARFETICKSTWSTLGFGIKYDGDLQVQPAGPGQVTARFSLKLQWGSAMGLIISQGVMVIIAAMFNPYYAAFALFLILGSMGFTAWSLSSSVPEKTLGEFIKNLQSGGQAPAFQPAPQPSFTPQPAPAPAPAPTPAPAPAGDGNAAAIMEQIKQLGSLRDAGVLTPDEFESKKAELLKRI
ncbi:MAG: SHOCT domain-containing protein [Hyphomonadaceae bacterium]|nr:SHOCT domain-containing protein [Hyphomonadaceae bacterium]